VVGVRLEMGRWRDAGTRDTLRLLAARAASHPGWS
jgi:hypothetical protein